VGAYLVDKKNDSQNLIEGEGKKNYCVFYLPDAEKKKPIDQVYKRRPKKYLGRERKEEKIIEF
jgi:hypothetical protein